MVIKVCTLLFDTNYHFGFSLILKVNLSIEKSSTGTTLIHFVEGKYLAEDGRVIDKGKVEGVRRIEVSLQSTFSIYKNRNLIRIINKELEIID